jgi:hypothetical protein
MDFGGEVGCDRTTDECVKTRLLKGLKNQSNLEGTLAPLLRPVLHAQTLGPGRRRGQTW